jgi:hypothetical protein
MFFGRGTFHDAGANLMMSLDNSRPGARDRFAFDHSPAQQQFIDAVFGEAAPRANDRLRNAGPRDGWDQAGPTVNLLLYDADKNNSFHRTQHYQVQVGWYELDAKRNLAWRSEVHQIAAEPRTIEVPTGGSDAAVEELLLIVACRGGMTELSGDLNNLDICDRDASAFLPTFAFKLPYEETTIAVRRAFTRYWWRFQTYNGAQYSGWTGWSSFYRSF